MKLSKIYSNKKDIFEEIKFNDGFNVIFGEVENPKDKTKDSHNLGKTLLIDLIEFLMLKDINRSENHFLKKHAKKFEEFTFYLELELNNKEFLTIKRSVKENTKISFKSHKKKYEDFSNLSNEKWKHLNVSLKKSKEILDSYLNLELIGDWDYRTGITYFLRNQHDYQDVFQISKFIRNHHIYWKPYIMKILGFDDKIIIEKYKLDGKIDEKNIELERMNNKIKNLELTDYDKLKSVIKIKERGIKKSEKEIEQFNFFDKEIEINEEIVKKLEIEISEFNNRLYNVGYEIEKINKGLDNGLKFKVSNIQKIFEESKIYFGEQIIDDYNRLIKFNKQIFSERKKYLKERLKKLIQEENEIKRSLREKEERRSVLLKFVREKDSFKKFKSLQKDLIDNKTELNTLKNQLDILETVESIKEEINELDTERVKKVKEVKDMVNKKENPLYEEIKEAFNEIIKEIFDQPAILSISFNKNNNPEFHAEIAKDEKIWETTSEGDGTSWKKILCVAFDLSVLRAHRNHSFFKFVYHDGILEGLDHRKKINLIQVIERYLKDYEIQYIITLIKDDLPRDPSGKEIKFEEEKIIRRLNDSGDQGRLFKMKRF